MSRSCPGGRGLARTGLLFTLGDEERFSRNSNAWSSKTRLSVAFGEGAETGGEGQLAPGFLMGGSWGIPGFLGAFVDGPGPGPSEGKSFSSLA